MSIDELLTDVLTTEEMVIANDLLEKVGETPVKIPKAKTVKKVTTAKVTTAKVTTAKTKKAAKKETREYPTEKYCPSCDSTHPIKSFKKYRKPYTSTFCKVCLKEFTEQDLEIRKQKNLAEIVQDAVTNTQ